MNPLWLASRYLFDRALTRARAALNGDPESGALTLEWIIIASVIAVAAVGAGAFFVTEVTKYRSKLP